MTKVSLIIPSFEVGGTESSFIRKANFLKNTDFIPEMVYWTEGGELRKNLDSNIKVVKLNASSLWQLFFQFINYFNKSKPKIIHTPTFMVANIALIARIFSSHKPKIIIGARSDFDSVCKASKNYFDELKLRKLSQFLYPKSDRIVAVSKGVKNSLLASLDIEDSKIEVIYNGILTKKHRDNYEKPNHPWFVSKEICLISSIGRLSPEKGIYELICAFREALKLNSNLRLLIIGEGDEEKKIRKYLNDYSINDFVEITSFRDDYYSYLSNADIFVLNSYYEGMPSILVEATSTDAAIISTNCKHGPNELLNGVDNCRLIEVNNENQLIDAINHFSRIRKIKRKKIEHLHEFNIEESMSKYLKLLRELII